MPEDDGNLFGKLEYSQKRMVFEGLMRMIASESTSGFTNCDKGHPAYSYTGEPGPNAYEAWGDSPEHNELYKMLVELSEDLRGDPEVKEFVNCWQDFCRIAKRAYEANRKSN